MAHTQFFKKKESVLRNTSIKNEFTEDGFGIVTKGRINESVNRSKEIADAVA